MTAPFVELLVVGAGVAVLVEEPVDHLLLGDLLRTLRCWVLAQETRRTMDLCQITRIRQKATDADRCVSPCVCVCSFICPGSVI